MVCVADTSHLMDDDTVSSNAKIDTRIREPQRSSGEPDEIIVEIAKAIARRLARDEYEQKSLANEAETSPNSQKRP